MVGVFRVHAGEVFSTITATTTGTDSTFAYKKSITIAGTAAGAQTNYRLKLMVYRGEGTDSGNSCYLNNFSEN